MRNTVNIFLFLVSQVCFSADSLKVAYATRTQQAIKIDGVLNESDWNSATEIDNFRQSRPVFDAPPLHKTTVRILYNDVAIYVSAIMYDNSPDSILKQLGRRDEENLNADDFYFKIDPYHNNQDAYQFGVNAAGVQFDSRFSDLTYDAVWGSAARITNEGWIAEMEIPYSAIRFPKTDIQNWGLQLTRTVRRTREFDQWALTPLTASNSQLFWGILKGVEKIASPLRLSFTPYISSTLTRQPVNNIDNTTSYESTFSYSAGADIKYGIDDRFTLDMILLPDFGQVQSDKQVKNLGYQEIVFDENRSFFKEGVELFSKGNLFYSRRIGRKPSGYDDIYNELTDGEIIEENPSQVKLLNAFKISGRTNNGLGIGLFNAITNNTYAEIKNNKGEIRKVLTEPLTDFNIFILDQQLKNNSNFYFINTHTNRDKGYSDANVSAGGFLYSNKQNTFVFSGDAALSQLFSKTENRNTFTNTIGYKYRFGVGKQGGKLQYGIDREEANNEFNTSDLGYFIIPGYVAYSADLDFQQYNPWKFIRESFHNFDADVNTNYATNDIRFNEFKFNSFMNLLNYNAIFLGAGISPFKYYDYRESRSDGRKYRPLSYYFAYGGVSSDYRKPIAVDITITTSQYLEKYLAMYYQGEISFRLRVNNHLFIKTFSQYTLDRTSMGYTYLDPLTDKAIFGLRRLTTYENSLSINYIIKNDMLFNLTGRHYWNTADYNIYFNLLDNGELEELSFINDENDFSSNFFNVDVFFEWRFAPGSIINLFYKNAIDTEGKFLNNRFDENFNRVLSAPQTNVFGIKLLYYLDYNVLKRFGNKIVK